MSAWNNKLFKKWLDDFHPDLVFFASGDYSFIYRIAYKIAKKRNIPLVVSCMDDYYFNNHNRNKLFGGFTHNLFMKQVKKTMSYAQTVFCICEKMSRDYSKLFHIDCYTLHTPSTIKGPLAGETKNKISYIGNLGYQRYFQLVQIGKALKELNLPEGPSVIDVYSSESSEEILKYLAEENGIKFHGQIPFDEVKGVIAESLAVIHTESFDEDIANSVRYSVSTKIADSLASGTCILAYGPKDIASIEYLAENNAAFVIDNPESLKSKLYEFIFDQEQRHRIQDNALKLAKENHDIKINTRFLATVLKSIAGKFEKT